MRDGVMLDDDKWQAEEAVNKEDSAHNADLNATERTAALECKAKLKAQLKLLPRYILPVTRTTRSLRLRCLIFKLGFLILPHCNLSFDCAVVYCGWVALNLRI